MVTGPKHRVVERPITSICKTSCRYVGKENRMSINPMRNAHAAPRCRGLIRISSGYDNRTSLILFRHPGVNALVQCGILYDVTRAQRTVVNCYELK